jgi:adenosylcobinamide amidohydrolase
LTHLSERCAAAGADPRRTIGFMTAAKLTHASIQGLDGDRFRLLCCATAGTRNAARAGDPRATYSAYAPGTINISLFVDGRLTESAMAGAIVTATEAKSAALQELGVTERETGRIATGTTTDAIAVCVSQRTGWGEPHAYAGSATSIGCSIGEAVFRAVHEAVRTQGEP